MKESLLAQIATLEKSLSNPMLAKNPEFRKPIEEQLAKKKEALAALEAEKPEPKKAEPKEKAAPKKKAEPKAKAKAEPKEKPAPKAKAEKKNEVVIAGKTYSLDECEDAFKAWNAKKKQAVKATDKSENKQITTKVSDKVEVLTKQVFGDASVKKKMEKDPAQAKRDIRSFVKALEALFGAIEKLTGKKISKTNRDKIIGIIDDNQ